MAVLRIVGAVRTTAIASAVLDTLWEAVESGSSVSPEALQDRIDSIPESQLEDPRGRAYLAAAVLDVLSKAVDTLLIGAEPIDYEDAASGLFSEFDSVGQGPRRIDPRNPSPPGLMERAEEERLQRDIELMSRVGDRVELVRELRVGAQQQAEELAGTLPPVVKAFLEV